MKSIIFPFEQLNNLIEFVFKHYLARIIGLYIAVFFLYFISCFIFDNEVIAFFFKPIMWVVGLSLAYLLKPCWNWVKKKFNNKKNIDNKSNTVRIDKKKSHSSWLFFYLIIVFIGIVYTFTTQYYNEQLNIFSYFDFPCRKDMIQIYSAENSGNYRKIMNKITLADSTHFKESKIKSSGGYENSNLVLLDPVGIGFVQEDIYKDGDKIKEQLNYVTPLYMEKLHILYNKNSQYFRDIVKDEQNCYLSIGNNALLLKAIRNSRIAVGKAGSSTKILSSILLSEISANKPFLDGYNIDNASLDDAIAGIRKYDTIKKEFKYDIIFFMAGQPVDSFQNLLKSDSFGLIGIEPAIVDAINKTHNTQYRYTDFSVKEDTFAEYGVSKQYDKIMTLGSYSYLIANKKVKPYLINKFISTLSDLQLKDTDLKISFFNFVETSKRKHEELRNRTFALLLLTLSGGIALGTLILSFLSLLISSFNHDKLSADLASVVINIPNESIPSKEEFKLEKENDKKEILELKESIEKEKYINQFEKYYELHTNTEGVLDMPYLKFYQINILNDKIVKGMSELIKLRRNISVKLENGLLNPEHFNDLHNRIDGIMDKLRKTLFLRLYALTNRKDELGKMDIKNDEIIRYLERLVASSYLHFDDYKKLGA